MNEITYHREEDYLIPDLYLPKQPKGNIGKYGHLRLEYLKNHKKAEYTIMFINKTLRKHIVDTDIQAKARVELLINEMLKKNPIAENLKNTNPLEWTGLMNNYKNCAEKIVLEEFIYC